MITQFRLENFKGHRDTTLALRQFTVLVGDNSSGKTSVLEALRLMSKLLHANGMEDQVIEDLIHRGEDHLRLSCDGARRATRWAATFSLNTPPMFGHSEDDHRDPWEVEASGVDDFGRFDAVGALGFPGPHVNNLERIARLVGTAALYRFRAEEVAKPAYSEQPDASIAEDGALTAVTLAALKLADDARFNAIEGAMRTLVPALQRIFIKPAKVVHPSNPNPVTGSKLYFDFQGAKNVPAHHASQGTLVVLALLSVLHDPHRPRVVLLDDFDHALHPRAQVELVRMIKQLLALEEFQDTQIIATTHSPYVLDEVTPADVIAFALRDDGTVAAKPLSEHPDAPKVNGALKAGELWTLDAERDWVR